jgi:hypothetical protein
MIITLLLTFAVFIIETLLLIFPSSTGFPTEVTTAVTTFGSYITIIDAIVPMDTLGYIVGLIIAMELLIFSFKGLRWLISHIPFIGGRG